jgi:7-keto-8-aminopelargonate synthetase-like enzyme
MENLVQLKEKYGAWLLLDEAHANGVIGPVGSGWAAKSGCTDRIDIQMGTLGKSLGSSGGFVAASSALIDHFLNEARTFLFGTAPAPAAMAAAAEALQILSSSEGDQLRDKLNRNILLHASLHPASRHGPIQPWRVKSNEGAVRARDSLFTRGIEVAAIRPPTVPEGSARLRLSLSARHSEAEVRRLAEELQRLPAE